MKRSLYLLLTIIFLFAFSGCVRNQVPNWLVGNWVLDSEATVKANIGTTATTVPMSTSTTNVVVDVFSSLTSQLMTSLVQQLQGMEIAISERQETASFRGNVEVRSISVYEKTSDSCTLKRADNRMVQYKRTPSGFSMYSDDGKVVLVFKRK